MDAMEEYEGRSSESEELPVASTTEASLRSQITDLLLGGPRDVRVGRLTPEHSDVLRQIEAELEAYASYFYPPEHYPPEHR
jgi:hypothetical protein